MSQPRPLIRTKTFYLELDGKPSCCSNALPQGSPPWRCSQSSHKEAQDAALLVWRDHPEVAIAIREGPCPRSRDDGYDDRWEEYD